MQLSANFLIDSNTFFREQFLLSKNLYNQGRYLINEQYNENKTFINETTLNRKLRTELNPEYNNYKKFCKAKVAQNTLRALCKCYKSYFRAIKDFKVNPSKYKGMPKPPKYKDTLGILYFDYQSIKIKDQFIVINKEHKVHIPNEVYKEELNNFKTISFIPFYNRIKVVISYEVETTNEDLNQDQYLSIDLGMNNLCSCVSKDDCFILNGKPLKSINQYFNKELSKLKSERPLKGKYQDYNSLCCRK